MQAALYSLTGQLVRVVVPAQRLARGAHAVALGSPPAGFYLVKLQVDDQVTSRKVVME